MTWNLGFFTNTILLGVGLAMDAFSVSLVNGLNEPNMKIARICMIAGVFAFFQALMPMIGWGCVQTFLQYFRLFDKILPWIALIILVYIGGKMLREGLQANEAVDDDNMVIAFTGLLVQGLATSVDALSVGFTIAEYDFFKALLCASIISMVTFVICTYGLIIGSKAGAKYTDKAAMLGGVILIFIGLQIGVKAF